MAGRPPGAQNKDKPLRDALRMEAIALANGEVLTHPIGSLRWNAQQLLMRGETASIKEVGDRLDGKPAQIIAGDSDEDPINILQRIERVIVDPNSGNPPDSDSSDIPPAA